MITLINARIPAYQDRQQVEIGLTDLKGDIKVLDGKIEGIDNRLISVIRQRYQP